MELTEQAIHRRRNRQHHRVIGRDVDGSATLNLQAACIGLTIAPRC